MWEKLEDDCVLLIAWRLMYDDVEALCALRRVRRSARAAVEEVILQDQGADTERLFAQGYGISLEGRRAVLHNAIRRLHTLYDPRVCARAHSPLRYVCGRCGRLTRELLACTCHVTAPPSPAPPSPTAPSPSPPPLETGFLATPMALSPPPLMVGFRGVIGSRGSVSRMLWMAPPICSVLAPSVTTLLFKVFVPSLRFCKGHAAKGIVECIQRRMRGPPRRLTHGVRTAVAVLE